MVDCISFAVCFVAGIVTLFFYIVYSYIPKDVNWIRYIKARYLIRSYQQKYDKKFVYKDIKKKDVSPYDVGLLPSPFEYEIENPKIGTFKHCDSIQFTGLNFEKQFVDICISRIKEDLANVFIFLQLSNGEKYRLPISEDTRQTFIPKEYGFYSSGLQIKCLAPFRKWRISFNGLLQKCNFENELEISQMTHVKFSFLWHSMSVVQERNIDFNSKDLAKSLSCPLSSTKLERFHELQDGYEQWGQLMGTVHVKGKEDREMYLWSNRTRSRNSFPKVNFSSTKLFMYFEDGFPMKVETLSIENLLSNYTSSYTIDDLGGAKQIEICKIDPDLLNVDFSKACLTFKNFGLQKDTNRNMTIDFIDDKDEFSIGSDLEIAVVLKRFKVFLDSNDYGTGVLYFMEKSNSSKFSDFSMPPMLLKDSGIIHPERSIIPLNDETCKSCLLSGGKGSSLSLLTSLSEKTSLFDVPKGFVITTFAFDEHLKNNPSINYAIQRVINISCGKCSGDLKEECVRCSNEFKKSKLSEILRNDIQEILICLFDDPDSLRYSIRSSACDEDSEDYSAAGQMLTILGVRSLENIFKAVIECWSSKFGFEAVQYTRQNGQPIRSSMAVVVQEMVPSEVSGVLFTVDPVTGDPTYPHITANYGLGETVVSSLAEPDTIVLKRKHNSLEVERKIIGSKKTQVYMTDGNGTMKKNLDNKMQAECLSDEWAIKIGSVGILIETCFCIPQDIEWAYYKNKLYLLQARPITTLHTETEFELIHDQDTPIRSHREFWTRANVGEVYLGATSPLGISLIIGAVDTYGLRNRFRRELFPVKDFCPYLFHTVPITHKQAVLNLIDVLFRINDKEITSYQKAFEVSLFGREIGTKEMHEAGVKKYGYMSRVQLLIGIPYIIAFMYLAPKWTKESETKLKNFNLPLDTYTTVKKTWEALLVQIKFLDELCTIHGTSTFLSSYYNLWVLTILAKGKKEWDTELYSNFSVLLSACSGIESADVPESLQELAQVIARHQGSTFSSLPSNIAYNLLENDCSLAGVLFKEFLRKHGHRCIKEFDLCSKSWGMEPESVIPILQSLVNSPNILKPQPKEVTTLETVMSKLKIPLSRTYKRLLKFILPWSRNAVREREKTKSMLIKYIDWLRKTVCQLGELLVQDGMLPSKDLIFFLTLDEVSELFTKRKPGLVSKAIRRKKLHPQLDILQFPEIINGIPKPINHEEGVNILSTYPTSFTLKGTPVCQGKVKATARVVRSLDETSTIQSGDILITYSTDIGWTPYFPLLSGVVTVLGGLISHGAVVAREYGLPCIVGAENAMSVFKSGDLVILDGTKGTITKIVNEDDAANE